jgi:hypothetical protein
LVDMSDKTSKIGLEDLSEAQEMVIQVIMQEGAMRNQEETIVDLQAELDAVVELGDRSPDYLDGFEHAMLFLKSQWGMPIE